MPSIYKLTLTKTVARDDGKLINPGDTDCEVLYVHELGTDVLAARQIVHELTRPVRAKRGRPLGAAKAKE